jgi:uncharacterized protein (DUF1501 family)
MSTIDQDRAKFLRTRRGFLRDFGTAALGSLAVSSTLRDFRLINSAIAQGNGPFAFPDYKALVCVFLSGGNDSNNLVIPRGTAHANYAAIRQNLTIPESALLPINPADGDGNEYGLHPSCSGIANLFEGGKAAILFNVGPLLFPTTRIQYQKKLVALPPQLFSHSDQVMHWQTSLPDQPPRTGWGGRIADLLHPYQDSLINDPVDRAKIALCTSIAGANTFEVGASIQQYHVSTGGAVVMSGTGGAVGSATKNRESAIRTIAKLPQSNLQAGAYGDIIDDAIGTGVLLNEAIAGTSTTVWETSFPTGSFGDQMKMVARIIAARDALKIKRQIFFVSFGSYDTHTSQVGVGDDPLTGTHANLLAQLSNGIAAFHAALGQLGGSSLQNSVVGFTASDFGRTMPTNGQGSDHGWGSHHLIFGGDGTPNTGAVRGKRTYGTFPVLQVNGPDDTSTGRWIPTTSVDEYSATLARWFGVDDAHMPVVFPNLGRFAAPDLGFLNI